MDRAYLNMWRIPLRESDTTPYRVVKVWIDDEGDLHAMTIARYAIKEEAESIVMEMNNLIREISMYRARGK